MTSKEMKKVKLLTLTYIISVLIICSSQTYSQTNDQTSFEQHIKSITIKYVDFDIETPARINCDKFELSFGTINAISLRQNEIAEFIKTFKCYTQNLSEADLNLDTRGKIEITFENYTKVYCFNDYLLSYDNKIFFISEDLMKLINEKIKSFNN